MKGAFKVSDFSVSTRKYNANNDTLFGVHEGACPVSYGSVSCVYIEHESEGLVPRWQKNGVFGVIVKTFQSFVLLLSISSVLCCAHAESIRCEDGQSTVYRVNSIAGVEGQDIQFSDLISPLDSKCTLNLEGKNFRKFEGNLEFRIAREEIRESLLRLNPGIGLNVVGPDFVLVRKLPSQSDIDYKILQAKTFLLDQFNKAYDIKVKALEVVRLEHDKTQYSGLEGDTVFRWEPRGRALTREVVWVDMYKHGALYKSLPLWFSVDGFQKVQTLSVAVAQGAEIFDNLLVERYVDITDIKGRPFKVDASNRFHVVRPIEAGAVLLLQDVRPVPAVSQGDTVTVVVRNSRIYLETLAVALNSGEVGDTVRLKSPSSEEIFFAKVIDNNSAVIP